MYGNAYPSSSMQTQSQGQGGTAAPGGMQQANNSGVAQASNFNFANMMGIGGMTAMAMDGQQQQQLQQTQDGPIAPNGINPALMFNPQLQALLQQQMAQQQGVQASQMGQQQQQQQQQQPQSQLQQMRWPVSAATGQSSGGPFAQQKQPGDSSQGGQQMQTPYGQVFNPFLQQQQLHQQQQNLGMPMGAQPGLNNFAAAYLAQAQQQQQQQQQRLSGQNTGNMANPSAFMGMNNGAGGNGIIDPSALMQANSYAAMSSAANGTLPPHMQPSSAALQQTQTRSPKTSSNASGIGTPEPKPKGRPKGSTKKKKEETARLQQQQQLQQQQLLQQQQQQQQQLQHHPLQSMPFAHSTDPPSAPSFQQTPTPSHASIPPHASPGVPHILAQQQDRARSHTKSPSMSGSFAQAGGPSAPTPANRAIPPGWTPSLSAIQQQQLLGQALSFSRAQSARAINGQQQTPSPAHILMQLGYVYVKAAVLPNNGQGAGIPGNGASGAGAVLSIEEARMIGLLPQAGSQGQIQQQSPAYPAPPMSEGSIPPQTPLQSHTMAPPAAVPPSQTGPFRPMPMNQQPTASSSLPPSSPNVNGTNSPARKQASNRARQTSLASRPDSSHGHSGPEAIPAQQSSFTGFAQPPSMQQQQQQQQMQMQHSLRMRTSLGSAPVGGGMSAGPPLAPVHGGPLPKQSSTGLDVAEYNTRLTPLPPSHILTPDASHSALEDLWKPLTKAEEDDLLAIMKRDGEYTKIMNNQTHRNNTILYQRIQQVRPIAFLHWWERGADEDQSQLGKDGPFESFKILLPADKRMMRTPPGGRSALFSNMSTKQVTLERLNAAKYEEDLVPVRLEIEHEGWTLRDTFTWPAPESYKNDMIERFAITLCDDFGLPSAHFVSAIRENILSQVSEHTAAEAIRPVRSKGRREEAMGRGKLCQEEVQWWKQWRKQLEMREQKEEVGKFIELDDDESNDIKLINGTRFEAELRIQIKLDVTVGAMNLVDQFEWDVSDEGSAAESFATVFAADLGLSGEFKTAIAHSIREQVDVYIRSLALIGYSFDGKEVLDDELREPLLSKVACITRTQQDVESYTPKLMQLSELEILHAERERDKESRRKRRQTRGRRGVNLPDREPLKTARTAAIVGLQQGTNQALDGVSGGATDLFGLSSTSQARSGAMGTVSGGRGGAGISTRRAAAAAANANIISHGGMHEYGTPTPAPEAPYVKGRQGAKRRKMESQSVHFEYPGGLGRSDDLESRGPRFAPSLSLDKIGQQQKRSAELGNAPAKAPLQVNPIPSQPQSVTAASAGPTATTPTTPVAWNMSKPEEASTQHPVYHDGQWHCSNCGVPGNLDGTRRKGPLGDKTLCGICGKFFHRHRKARPIEFYTRDVQHHRRELAARGVQGMAVEETHSAADSPMAVSLAAAGADEPGPETKPMHMPVHAPTPIPSTAIGPQRGDKPLKVERDLSFPNTRGNSPDLPFEQVGSPDDSDNSDTSRPPSPIKKFASEAARSVSPNKAFPLSSLPPLQPQGSPVTSTPPPLPPPPPQQAPSTSAQSQHAPAPSPPDWLTQACHTLRMRFPLDRFDVQIRQRAAAVAPSAPIEWRIRCLDCPGKLYTPGPGESLTNFEIHLKNRAHRAAVQKSVQLERRRPYGS